MLSLSIPTTLPSSQPSSCDQQLVDSDPEYTGNSGESSALSPNDDIDFSNANIQTRLKSELCSLHHESVRARYETDPIACEKLIDKYLQRGVRVGWCVSSQLVPSRHYIQVSVEGANKCMLLHELLCWSRGLKKTVPDEDYSHLCHNPVCCVAAHVVVERAVYNQSRKGCPVWVDCPHPAVCGGKKIFLCKHEPACIKFCEKFDDLETFLKEGVCSFV